MSIPPVIAPAVAAMLSAGEERLCVAMIAADGHYRGMRELVLGPLQGEIISAADVYTPAQEMQAAQVCLIHRQAEAEPQVTPEDEFIAQRMALAGTILGIVLLDYIVVGQSNYISLVECGIIGGDES